jgi:thiamine biosynthesis lipoprotein
VNALRQCLVAASLLTLLGSSARKPLETQDGSIVQFRGTTMGTTYSVKIATDTLTTERRAQVHAGIGQRLLEINRAMSTYDGDSELEMFNRGEEGLPFRASRPLIEVFTMAREVSERTGGAFDITVRPLVEAWGFGSTKPPLERPPDSLLDVLRQTVGYRRVSIDPTAQTLTRTQPDVMTDLSAIAKGYGVDVIAHFLQTSGFCCFLVEIGGELKARGVKPGGMPWRIGLEAPTADQLEILGTIELGDAGMATSGDYRQFVEWNDKRFAHVIDPRTGYPVPYRSASVTVVHPETTLADAWATGLSVLGPHEGYIVAEAEGIAAHFAWSVHGEIETRATTQFQNRYPVSEATRNP